MRDHDSTVEEWRPIPGFVHYEASNLGRIRSLERVITVTRLGHTYQRTVGGCLIGTTPSATSTANYRTIGLCRDGKTFSKRAHIMVALAWLGETPPGLECCHNDGDKTNNALTNLRYDTHASNMADMVKHGTQTIHRGEASHLAKLTASDVISIRAEAANSTEPVNHIARRWGISGTHCRRIVSRSAWGHI